MKIFSRVHLADVLLFIVVVLFTAAGIAINLNKFWQYEAGYYDFGIFDHAIWEAAHFRAPIIDHFIVPGRWIFGDHFNPTIFLLSPIYWFTSNSEALLIAQDIIVAFSGVVLYAIGNQILKNRWVSLSVVCAYFLFIGLQNAVYSDFHELSIMTLPLMLTYWAILKGHLKRYIIFLFLMLGCKETLFVLGIGIGLFIVFSKRKWRKIGLATIIFSVLYGLVCIKVIVPFFAHQPYYYLPKSPESLTQLASSLFSPGVKIQTVFWTFASFLFLPLAAPELLQILVLNFVSRFTNDASTRWGLGLHYSAEIAPTLAVGTVLGLQRVSILFSKYLKQFRKKEHVIKAILAIALILVSLILYRFVLRGPFGLAYNPAFYAHTKDFQYLDQAVARIPKGSSVLAQNNLASRFLHQQVWILHEGYRQHKTDYIIIDLRPGQSPVNHLGINDLATLLQDIKKNREYKKIYQKAEVYIFKRIRYKDKIIIDASFQIPSKVSLPFMLAKFRCA